MEAKNNMHEFSNRIKRNGGYFTTQFLLELVIMIDLQDPVKLFGYIMGCKWKFFKTKFQH